MDNSARLQNSGVKRSRLKKAEQWTSQKAEIVVEQPRPSRQPLKTDVLILGDCLEQLRTIPEHSIDLVILDPPYWKVVGEEWDFQWRTKSDYAEWCSEWLKEVARVTKLSGSIYLFGYVRNLVYLYQRIIDLGFIFRQQLIIDKGIRCIGGRKTSTYKMFPNVTEAIWFFVNNSKPFIRDLLKERQKALGLTSLEINTRLGVKTNGGGVWSLYTGDNILAQVPTREMWERLQEVLQFSFPYEDIAHVFNIEMGVTDVWTDIDFYAEKRYHPTQKPVRLLERIIRASSNPGMVVLDPFAGVGSTAVACKNLDRRYICIEKDEDFLRISRERIEEAGQTLF